MKILINKCNENDNIVDTCTLDVPEKCESDGPGVCVEAGAKARE